MSSKARKRQKVTGEKYCGALRHVRGECARCRRGEPCDACTVEPCWTCKLKPCAKGNGKVRCSFDDLVGRLKFCSTCGAQEPHGFIDADTAKHWVECSSDPAACPVLPSDSEVKSSYSSADAKALYDDVARNGVQVPDAIRWKFKRFPINEMDELEALEDSLEPLAKERNPCLDYVSPNDKAPCPGHRFVKHAGKFLCFYCGDPCAHSKGRFGRAGEVRCSTCGATAQERGT